MSFNRSGGFYKSTIHDIPTKNGHYFYSYTYLERDIDTIKIYTVRGFMKNSPSVYFSKLNETLNDLIIDYIIFYSDFMIDKKVTLSFRKILKEVNIILSDIKPGWYNTRTYNKNDWYNESLFIKKMIEEHHNVYLAFLNKNHINTFLQ